MATHEIEHLLMTAKTYITSQVKLGCVSWLNSFALAKSLFLINYASYFLIAEDLITGPASQAYVERILSLGGWLTAGRSYQLTKIWK